jgi:hypothetical protein
MKRFSILSLGMVIGLSAASGGDAVAQIDRANDRTRGDQVCVYKDINYFGAEQCYRPGEEINNLGAQNNSLSSIRVYGRMTVTVYEKTAFGGHSAEFTSDVPDLGKRMMQGSTGWSDRIASLRIGETVRFNDRTNSDRTNNGGFGRNQADRPRDGICVYDLPNYEGRSDCWNQGENISDTSRAGSWNGEISSIRLFGNRTVAVVYQDIGYRGESMTIDRNIPDLSVIPGRGRGNANGNGNGNGRGQGNGRNFRNWDRQISSLQVQTQRQSR